MDLAGLSTHCINMDLALSFKVTGTPDPRDLTCLLLQGATNKYVASHASELLQWAIHLLSFPDYWRVREKVCFLSQQKLGSEYKANGL